MATQQPPPPQDAKQGNLTISLEILLFVVFAIVAVNYVLRMVPKFRSESVISTGIASLIIGITMTILIGAWPIALIYTIPASGLAALLFDWLDKKRVG